MSKRESPVGFISILVVTFGLSVAGIWSAYQFGFGSHSDVEYTYVPETNNVLRNEYNKKEKAINITPTPTATATPKRLKTAADLVSNPVQTEIKFLFDSNKIAGEGVEKLNQLKKKIAEFDHQSAAVRIYSNSAQSDFSQQIARQRGEEIAGYLRHLGLKNKIVISRRSKNSSSNSLSFQQKRNQPIVVELYKL
ncbi:MAG: hypothetical protein MJK14_23370 [Rivularia sp. ALOHA_DT_140]|nr:hypothetical protein [Rivularia sp. ALOHA_DT_140]